MSVQNEPTAHVLFRRGDELLFVLRSNTGYMDGHYCLPSGRVEPGETYSLAAAREALEEVGLQVSPGTVSFVYVQHRLNENNIVFTDVFFEAGEWNGEPINAEPDKHSEVAWFSTKELPDNLMPSHRYALEQIARNKLYGEFGWPSPETTQ